MPQGNSVQSPREGDLIDQITRRPFDRSDFIKLGAAGALSLLIPKSASAAIESITKIDGAPLLGPPGYLKKEVNDTVDSAKALNEIDYRWQGVLMLCKGKTPNQVSITTSPFHYALPETNNIPPFSNKTNGDYLFMIDPYIISDFEGRTFAAVWDVGHYEYGFLDLAWAISNGTLRSLAKKVNGKVQKPHAIPFRFGQDVANQPVFTFDSIGPEQGYTLYQDGRGNEKKISFVPSKVFPKTKTRR